MKALCKKVLNLLGPYKKNEAIGILLTFLYAISIFLVPKASGFLIDDVIMSGSREKLWSGILLFTVICFLQPIFGFVKDVVFTRLTESITYDVREELFHKIIHAHFGFFDTVKGGELISIIMNDGRGVSDFISKIFASLLKNIALIIMIVIGMLTISVKITLVVLVCFIIFYLGSMTASKKLRSLSKNIQENYDAICNCVNQTNQAIMSIKSYNQQENTLQKYQNIIKKMKKDNIRINSIQILINNLSSAIVFICLAIIYGWGAMCVIEKTMTTGSIIAMGLYFQLLEQPFYELMNIGLNVNVIMPIFERLDKYKSLPQEELGSKEQTFDVDGIFVKHLNFSYDSATQSALKDINVHLPATGFVNIMGESGSGKSTFIKILLGIYRIEDDHVFFGAEDINQLSLWTLRNNISYVPQESEIVNDTIYNNICYGKQNVPYEKVIELCKKLNLHEKIVSLPNGYDSVVTERVNLSGGEKQRILIARGIVKDAPILILDEPYSALDEENIVVVSKLLMSFAKEKLILMVTHYECNEISQTMKIIFKNGSINNIIENK